jgi:hypothetical protein
MGAYNLVVTKGHGQSGELRVWLVSQLYLNMTKFLTFRQKTKQYCFLLCLHDSVHVNNGGVGWWWGVVVRITKKEKIFEGKDTKSGTYLEASK